MSCAQKSDNLLIFPAIQYFGFSLAPRPSLLSVLFVCLFVCCFFVVFFAFCFVFVLFCFLILWFVILVVLLWTWIKKSEPGNVHYFDPLIVSGNKVGYWVGQGFVSRNARRNMRGVYRVRWTLCTVPTKEWTWYCLPHLLYTLIATG